ncbi:tetratricopeptide repeat protein [Sphingobium sp. D43FB]|uniref:putative 2OG-Fe(II) oxygenase n=1 Tax=Sphingobium sp. D43FB TaxID=2017595 RepID=UPI000BB57C23|nr:tetratricopeptide repeat protein [Sphingobium sp. D43FB]PBN43737.1 hypothetical protein SxD43FB_10120 [Sphingobium sp. D43FB]
MTGVLQVEDVKRLQHAFNALQAGQAVTAERMLRAMAAPVRNHPDALYIFASARRAQGDMAGARMAFEAALKGGATNPQLWNAYGNHLHDMGDGAAAIAALQRAVAVQPRYAEGWINLAIVATDQMQFGIAEEALDQAARIAPQDDRILHVQGAMAQAQGRPEAAAAAYRALLVRKPSDLRACYNLATALRASDDRASALEAIERAIDGGLDIAPALTLRAHILAEMGRFDDAVAQYQAALRRYPDHVDAQDTLARLLPQIGREAEAFDAFDLAIEQQPRHIQLLLAGIRVAMDIRDHDRALGLIDRAQPMLDDPDQLSVVRIRALGLAGRHGDAIDLARTLAAADPARAGLQANLAQLLLAQGDPDEALSHALLATRHAPLDQTGWALLTVIWRLLEDEREHWLAGYDHYVRDLDIGTPDGWSNQSAFLVDLRESLERLHVTTAHPADQTLRGGTQTRGDLFDRRRCPVIMALKRQLHRCTQSALADLPNQPRHPLLDRRTGDIQFSGSWSVRLRENGRHVPHIHPQGWISSAFYVALPNDVPAEDRSGEGTILFGVPDDALNLTALPPRRVIQPQAGRLVLFPSYLWHGTAPFSGSQSRLTIAFDALPA